MHILGINAAFHDSSAAIVRDGIPIAAAEEERFTRIKHAKRPLPFTSWELPYHAIDYCLREAGIRLRDVDCIAYSYDPAIALNGRDPDSLALPLEPSARPPDGCEHPWEPLFLAGIINAPRFLRSGVPHHLQGERMSLEGACPRWEYVDHHVAHAASAYYVSGFDEAAVLTLDGRGEHATTTHSLGRGRSLERLQQVDHPHSLGLLYEEVTEYLGFLRSSDEYKVMALAAAGSASASCAAAFRDLVQPGEDGTYRVRAHDLAEMFGPPRRRGEPMAERHVDIATGLQRTLEDTVLQLATWLRGRSGARDLCMAGGVALNCVMNARLRDAGIFDRIFVQPAAGDAGTSLGAALAIAARDDGGSQYRMTHAYLGPGYDESELLRALDRAKLPYTRPPDTARAIAEILAEDRIAGWYQGRMEFGPRALGARSIVAAPTDPAMKDRLNAIKDREEFRPVAPAVLEERAADYFEQAGPSPFMLFVSDALPHRRDDIPAVCHIDGSARLQTVSREDASEFHRLIEAFAEITGVPVIVNTSFNTLGRPIVCTPQDAIECYATSPLDALALGPFLLRKD